MFQQGRPYVVALAYKEPLSSIRKAVHARELRRILLDGNHRERTSGTLRKGHVSSVLRDWWLAASETTPGASDEVGTDFF